MEQSQSGSYFLNENGINYLKEKRIETIKSSQDLKQVANNNLSSVATSTIVDNAEIINILKQNNEQEKTELKRCPSLLALFFLFFLNCFLSILIIYNFLIRYFFL